MIRAIWKIGDDSPRNTTTKAVRNLLTKNHIIIFNVDADPRIPVVLNP